jgi:hypothetical protein
MYKQGQLVAINGAIYEYGNHDEQFKVHVVNEVEIDDDGNLTATYVERAFTDAELSNQEISLTQKQWFGLVELLIRQYYDLTDEEITDATEDIVGRCFAYGIPKIHELVDYIADYMNR